MPIPSIVSVAISAYYLFLCTYFIPSTLLCSFSYKSWWHILHVTFGSHFNSFNAIFRRFVDNRFFFACCFCSQHAVVDERVSCRVEVISLPTRKSLTKSSHSVDSMDATPLGTSSCDTGKVVIMGFQRGSEAWYRCVLVTERDSEVLAEVGIGDKMDACQTGGKLLLLLLMWKTLAQSQTFIQHFGCKFTVLAKPSLAFCTVVVVSLFLLSPN